MRTSAERVSNVVAFDIVKRVVGYVGLNQCKRKVYSICQWGYFSLNT